MNCSSVTCKSCGNVSATVEDAFQLSVSIPEQAATGSRYITATDCLRNFLSETQLSVDAKNGYDCEKCSRPKEPSSSISKNSKKPALRDASVQLSISRLPRVLVIHLKRLGRTKKITQHIQFDPLLDMSSFVKPSSSSSSSSRRRNRTSYELIAVVVHKGNKRSGHYVAYVSRSSTQLALQLHGNSDAVEDEPEFDPRAEIHTSEDPTRSWYYISDSVVQSVTLEQVLQCEAYMLFYQQLSV